MDCHQLGTIDFELAVHTSVVEVYQCYFSSLLCLAIFLMSLPHSYMLKTIVKLVTVSVVVVELPRLLCTVVGRKPANLPRESDDIRRIRLDKFPVGQERLPKSFPSLLTPRQAFPQKMFSLLLTVSVAGW